MGTAEPCRRKESVIPMLPRPALGRAASQAEEAVNGKGMQEMQFAKSCVVLSLFTPWCCWCAKGMCAVSLARMPQS